MNELTFDILKEKNRIFLKMRDEVSECVRCPQLCYSRNQSVFGDGNPMARVMFIGEAPGRDEDKEGKPFVGRSGKLLNNILKACGWKREDVYIANVAKCRPPNNRVPDPEEIDNCSGYLKKQIEVINPEYIVCLGSVASNFIVGMPISRARGQWHNYNECKVICTWHPSYLLRNEIAKKQTWSDLQLLLEDMRQ